MKTFKQIALLCLSLLIPSCFSGHLRTGPDWEYKPRNALKSQANKEGKELKIKVISDGLGSIANSRANWGLLLNSPEKITLEKVKPLIAKFITALVDTMYENPLFADYYKKSLAESGYERTHLGLQDLAFRLDFWDENVDRPLYPYIAQVRLADGIVYYYYANPKTGALEETAKEPFYYTPKVSR